MSKHTDDSNERKLGRRTFLKMGAAGLAAAGAIGAGLTNTASASSSAYAPPENPALPPSDMVLDPSRAALVVSDPQIDFLSPDGVTWGVVGESVQEHNTVENLGKLFAAAKQAAVDRLAEARNHVGALRVTVTIAGATVTLDGHEIGTAPIDEELYVDPGPHQLAATMQGYEPAQLEVDAPAGETQEVELVLRRIDSPDSPHDPQAGEPLP